MNRTALPLLLLAASLALAGCTADNEESADGTMPDNVQDAGGGGEVNGEVTAVGDDANATSDTNDTSTAGNGTSNETATS